MSTALWIFGGVIALCTFGPLLLPHGPATPRHDSTRALTAYTMASGGINYAANPYRIGAYVYVMESNAASELDWRGTFIGMNGGMAMVRDRESGVVAHVNKDQLYGAMR